MFLGGAIHGIPIVMDGFISGVAALCAARLCPNAARRRLPATRPPNRRRGLCWRRWANSRSSRRTCTWARGRAPVASIPLWDMALAVYQNCYSFAEGGIEPYTPQC